MRRIHFTRGLLFGWLWVSVAACPKDDPSPTPYSGSGDAGSAEQSGVNPEMPISEATADQAARICEFVEALGSVNGECTRDALERASDEADCIERRNQCTAHKQSESSSDSCSGEEILAQVHDCTGLRVGDLETCFSALARWQDGLQCSSAGQPLDYPDCVVSVNAACPALFGDEENQDDEEEQNADPHCPPGDRSAGEAADCGSFCDALIAPQCKEAPTKAECLSLCEPIKRDCAPAFGALVKCLDQENAALVCGSGGGLDATGSCGSALSCFADCIEPIVE